MGEHPPGVVMARGELPEEPACNMNLSAQALHTVTIVFLNRTGFMTTGQPFRLVSYSGLAFVGLVAFAAAGSESVGPSSA